MAQRGTTNIPSSRLRGRNALERVLGRAPSREREGSWLQRILRPKWDQLVQGTVVGQGTETTVRQQLMRAGFPYGINAREFVVLKKIFVFLGGAIFVAFTSLVSQWFVLGISIPTYVIVGAVGMIIGIIAPPFWLSMVTRRRLRDMQRSLPDFVDLVTVSVEAGLGLVAALQEVSSRFRGPLGDEITRVLSELRVGRSLNDALRDMAARIKHEDFSQFVSQIIQAEQLGISIGNALRAQSIMMRDRRQLRAQEAAQKAPVKMMIPLILFILPTLFIVIMGPAALIAFRELSGTSLF